VATAMAAVVAVETATAAVPVVGIDTRADDREKVTAVVARAETVAREQRLKLTVATNTRALVLATATASVDAPAVLVRAAARAVVSNYL
jgi:hypothetical protein